MMHRTLNVLLLLFLINICLNRTAQAIELSLEENKGESGTVGYVDIEKVFRLYSGTLSARENFQKEIKDKEELINVRKSYIFSLKAEIAKLKQEREFALRLPLLIKKQEEINRISSSIVSISSQTIVSTVTGTFPIQVQSLDITDSTRTISQNNPSITTSPVEHNSSSFTYTLSEKPDQWHTTDHSLQTTGPDVNRTAVLSISTETLAHKSTETISGIDMPGESNVPLDFFKLEISTSVHEIDEAISKKEMELKAKEAELKEFQRRIELELLQYESNETKTILGKIYIVLKELAIREGVSVVIDKRNILFGHSAVDLTDKLLEKLEKSEIQ